MAFRVCASSLKNKYRILFKRDFFGSTEKSEPASDFLKLGKILVKDLNKKIGRNRNVLK
jgi:hypothetical protein